MDFDKLCGVALNRLGITFQEFYWLTPVEYHYALMDYQERLTDSIKIQYEVARWNIMHLWNMQGRHLRQVLREPKDVMPFPWEQTERKAQTLAQMKAEMQKIASMFSKRKKK